MKGIIFIALIALAFCAEEVEETEYSYPAFLNDLEEISLQLTDKQKETALNCLKAVGSGTPCYIKIADLIMTKNLAKIPGVILSCKGPVLDIVEDCLIPIYSGIRKVVKDAKKNRK
jgi:hypothetical protein